jgi:thiol:disulfide interchange protein DsbD
MARWPLALGCLAAGAVSCARSGGEAPLSWAFAVQEGDASSSTELDRALEAAKAAGKPAMVAFHADWCAACRLLDRRTFPAQEVARAARRFVTIRVDATDDATASAPFLARFGVHALPTIAFVSPTGEILASPRVTGFVGPTELVAEMSKCLPSHPPPGGTGE